MGTSYFFKIRKTTVYIFPFKFNNVKMKTIFSLKVTIKVSFPWNKKFYSMILVLTWFVPSLLVTIITVPHMDLPPIWWKNLFPQWFELFKIKMAWCPPHLLGREDTMPCGFHVNYSKSNALISITENIPTHLDYSKYVAGAFVDLKKAFDIVDHDILIGKLDIWVSTPPQKHPLSFLPSPP